ncbi:bifunctional folylpolyglutamate synthase/dihydrofolate synthase [Proteiniclasticum sp. C24MP]|uniref:bifunctional folylpolyglutamate synthase/dihydrofolate synthase n=1 Tax=Proteiniclasticum sp. C24MP TaxID=3374101 RepID=UPI0037545B01
MNYKETLEALHSIPRRKKEENLHRMNRLMEILGNPHEEQQYIHVAGTNGKGSISRMLEEVLLLSGYRTGLFTSPYIFDFRERIQIDNQMISEEDVIFYFENVKAAGEKLETEGYSFPSEFEVVTAMAFLYFRDQKVDVALIEVGIGGLYDATNVIKPVLSLIASINFDHTAVLGHTLDSIAWHKAGIMKGNPTISTSQQPEVRRVLKKKAEEVSSRLKFTSTREMKFLEMDGLHQKIRYDLRSRKSLTIRLSLLGIHQMLNAGVVLHAAEELKRLGYEKISDEAITLALEKVRWPGRMEVISEKPLLIIDGAHNMDGAINLKESLAFYFPGKSVILLLGMLRDKDVETVTKVLSRNTKKVVCFTPDDFRALEAERLLPLLHEGAVGETADSFQDAIEKALDAYEEGDLILCAGSLYTIGDMEHAFKKHRTRKSRI